MGIGYVLYNSKAGTDNSLEDIRLLEIVMTGELKFIDVREVRNYKVFLGGLEEDDYIVIAGGDGTLNRFINDTDGIAYKNEILYFPCGTGNDFAKDLGYSMYCNPFRINEYLDNLPSVTVNGIKRKFINGVGYGIDGYCCQVGDELKKTPGKKINYTSIAIKGLLFRYKPTNAKVTVDGKVFTYNKVWIAPIMNGHYYGGGMMPTPEQNRNSGTLSTMIFHGSGKLRTLMIFPSLFKGKHIKHKKYVDVIEGKEITIEFDRPTPLQIDGETVIGVTSCTAVAAVI